MYCDGMKKAVTRSGPRASAAMAVVRAESIPPERPMTAPEKPLLIDVVAHAGDQGLVDLGERVELAGDLRRERGALRRTRVGEAVAGGPADGVEVRAGERGVEFGRADGVGVDVDDEEGVAELGGAGDEAAVGAEHDALAVEDEFVLPAYDVDVCDEKAVLRRALGEHRAPLSAASAVVGRGGDVDHGLGAGEPLHRGRARVVPDVFADVDADVDAPDGEHGALVAALEVPLLVEHAVVGEEDLVVDGGGGAVMGDDGAVEDAALHFVGERNGAEMEGFAVDEVGSAGDNDDASAGAREAFELRVGVGEELLLEQQVFRGVAGYGEFGEGDEVGLLLPGLLDKVEHPVGVAAQVADGGVELAEGHAEGSGHDGKSAPFRGVRR